MADGLAEEAALDREPDLQIVGLHDDGSLQVGLRRAALGLGCQQHLGVLVLRLGEQSLRRSLFDDLAMLHDADMVGNVTYHAEVVGNQDDRHAELLLELREQFQDLRLHGHVERSGRLVGNQQFRIVGERHGDHYALALPA